jgi:hypothetical protein
MNDLLRKLELEAADTTVMPAAEFLAVCRYARKLEAALWFYEAPAHYKNPTCWNKWPCRNTPVDQDEGKHARAVLNAGVELEK